MSHQYEPEAEDYGSREEEIGGGFVHRRAPDGTITGVGYRRDLDPRFCHECGGMRPEHQEKNRGLLVQLNDRVIFSATDLTSLCLCLVVFVAIPWMSGGIGFAILVIAFLWLGATADQGRIRGIYAVLIWFALLALLVFLDNRLGGWFAFPEPDPWVPE